MSSGAVDGVPELGAVRSIYVRCPNWLGDFVMATAAFARLREAFPGARITAGMRPLLRDLLGGTAWFDEVQPTPRAGGPLGLWRQVQQVRAGRHDLAVVLPNSLETGLVPFLARVPIRIGYRQGRPLLLTHGLKAQLARRFWQPRIGPARVVEPMPIYYRKLLDAVSIPAGRGDPLHPRLAVTAAENEWLDAHLKRQGVSRGVPLVMFVVGANFGASKLWMPERFAAVARHFEQRGCRSLVLVGPAEVDLGRQIAEGSGALGMYDPVLPLSALKALVARADLVVTGDTGPRHLAVAFDRRIVCLIGPNDPAYTDYCMEHTALIRKDLECSPCQRKICPLGHHRCMRDITVDEVIAAGERLLAAHA